MSNQQITANGTVEQTATYSAVNPASGEQLTGLYRIASSRDIDRALLQAVDAFQHLKALPAAQISGFMRAVAEKLLSVQNILLARCAAETALPIDPRLKNELQRPITVLNLFADLLLSGATAGAAISPADPERKPNPKPDLRRLQAGVGPVAVLEASNFPLAFGVVGGDTASAWAARCPVIAKVHPFHPGTSEIIAEAIRSVAQEHKMPSGIFTLLHGDKEVVETLVLHPLLRGLAFTGSRTVGQIIRKLEAQRERPLDCLSLELGSVNPVFMLPGAFSDPVQLAKNFSLASLSAAGQFCTNPGVLIIPNVPAADVFLSELQQIYSTVPSFTLLHNKIKNGFNYRLHEAMQVNGVEVLARGLPEPALSNAQVSSCLLTCSPETFINSIVLKEEIFGPATLVIRADFSQMLAIARSFEGELTASLHGSESDWTTVRPLLAELELRVGRLIFNGYPPGVELCEATNHTGPWPAAHSRNSVVGPAAIDRWTRGLAYQNAPEFLLPTELLGSFTS